MTAIACALLSAIGFYFSIGLGEQWWLAWLAPGVGPVKSEVILHEGGTDHVAAENQLISFKAG